MIRVLKKNGLIFINAPASGPYHKFLGDNWRFKYNAAHSLAYLSNLKFNDYKREPVEIIECFTIKKHNNDILRGCDYLFLDYISIFKKTLKVNNNYSLNIIDTGILEKKLNVQTIKEKEH